MLKANIMEEKAAAEKERAERAAVERRLAAAEEAQLAAQEATALAEEQFKYEAWKASVAESAAGLAETKMEAEEDKVGELEAVRDLLAGELEQVRKQADILAQCTSALTAPKYKDITRDGISARSKQRA